MCVCEQSINMLLELLLVWGREGEGRKEGEKKKGFPPFHSVDRSFFSHSPSFFNSIRGLPLEWSGGERKVKNIRFTPIQLLPLVSF